MNQSRFPDPPAFGGRPTAVKGVVLHNLLLILGLPMALFIGQLVWGSEAIASLLFAGCVALCFLAYVLAGGWRNFIGLMILLWGGKLFVLALIVKVLVGESSTASLEAPRETALVYLLGFTAITLAVGAQKYLPLYKREGQMPQLDAAKLFYMTWILFGSSFLVPILTGERETYIALIAALGGFRDFSIFCAMHWAAARGSRRPHLHPLVLGLFCCCMALALASTSKQAILTPVMLYYLGVVALTGLRHPLIFLPLVPGLLAFQFIFGPMADTMKSQSTDLKGIKLYTAMWQANWDAMLSPEITRQAAIRARAETELRNGYYFSTDVGYIERFSLLKTGDQLIAATLNQGHTGWYIILWDLSMIPPRFIYPNKPVQGPASELARFSGALGDDDYTTAVSYGMFPELFNAQGYLGVLFLGLAAITLIFWWFRFCIGDHPGLTFYGLMLIGAIHHSLAEDTFGSFLGFFYRPLVMALAILPAIAMVFFFSRSRPALDKLTKAHSGR